MRMGFYLENKPMRWKRISQLYKKKTHRGIDLAAPTGTPVYATADGTVVSAKYGGWDRSYGNMVAIYHGRGTYTNHAHLSKIKVRVGQKVKAGQLIGLCGSTGNSTGPHLHFEIHLGRTGKNGKWDGKSGKWNRVNPKPYLDNAGKRKTFTKGKTYKLKEDMNVRMSPKASAPRVGVNKWSEDGKKHATKDGLLKKGTKVTVRDVYKNNDEVWIRTRSGWICAMNAKGKVYMS